MALSDRRAFAVHVAATSAMYFPMASTNRIANCMDSIARQFEKDE